LFTAVSQLEEPKKRPADLLLDDVRLWLRTDEHALAGGLATKLSEGEGRAIQLLTPPPKPPADPPSGQRTPPVIIDPPKPGWRAVSASKRERLTAKEFQGTVDDLAKTLKENPVPHQFSWVNSGENWTGECALAMRRQEGIGSQGLAESVGTSCQTGRGIVPRKFIA
jgi:hypothetical protein